MNIQEFLVPSGVVPRLVATSKKHAIEQIAANAAGVSGLDPRAVFELLLERERLGSTGLGHGIAIPHGKFAGLDRLCGVFARLATPIDFDAVDGAPVDLLFALLAPENAGADHLKALGQVSRLLRDRAQCDQLRAARTREALYTILTRADANQAA
ncbi:MAG: PTS IIA-like nitrogen regulatory protein PtsN [Alphaproteobacteria bacterium]